MGCGCKADKNDNINKENNDILKNVAIYTGKFFVFLVFILFLPIINILIIGFTFRLLVLNKNVNIKNIITHLTKLMGKKQDIDDDYDFETISEDDVILLDVEDISENK